MQQHCTKLVPISTDFPVFVIVPALQTAQYLVGSVLIVYTSYVSGEKKNMEMGNLMNYVT